MRWTAETNRWRVMSDVARASALATLVLACAGACGGRSDRDGKPAPIAGAANAAGTTSAGTSGSGGAGASAGAGHGGNLLGGAGTGAGGSSAGSDTTGGVTTGGVTSSGGTAGTGASGGAGEGFGGGASGTGAASGGAGFPECVTDEDCEIAEDCCSCQAVPKGAPVAACRVECGNSNGCEMNGLSTGARCTLGRCTLAASCDPRNVSCERLPPACSSGESPTVTEGGCWGPCVPSTECPEVVDCSACGDDAHCVQFPNVGGTFIRCIARQTECETGTLCECLSPCGLFECAERDGELGCFCAGC